MLAPTLATPTTPGWGCPQEYLDFRKERSRMLLSRRNQLLLEFSFWNEPLPRQGPNIYELRTYKLKVSLHPWRRGVLPGVWWGRAAP